MTRAVSTPGPPADKSDAIRLNDLSAFLKSKGFANDLEGDGDLEITAVNTLEHACDTEITFLANPKYAALLETTRAAAILVDRQASAPAGKSVIRCDDPYAAVTASIIRIHGHRSHPRWGVDAGANIAASVELGTDVSIATNVTIAEGARIGDRCVIYPGCYVSEDVEIGADSVLFPNVVIYDRSVIGKRVTIHAGSIIGQDGLGYAPIGQQWLKIPQVGRIVIGDDVEIGALCAFDRATLGETTIGAGTKFSNSVVVGHGAQIGENCMIVAQVGIAGSTKIGDHVTLAGQVGVSGHLTIGANARVGAQSGVRTNIEPGAEYQGSPATPSREFRRRSAALRKLPDMKQRLRELEREVARLRKIVDQQDD